MVGTTQMRLCPPYTYMLAHCRGITATRSLFHQRALAGLEWLGRIVRRDGGDQLVIVPRIFRFLRLLHLEQVGRDNAPSVDPQRALAEQRIVRRDFLHLGDDLGAVMGIAA